jgi:TPR repeat protein
MYEKGISVKQNFQKAYEYYKKAEALENDQAKFNIEYLKEKKLIN